MHFIKLSQNLPRIVQIYTTRMKTLLYKDQKILMTNTKIGYRKALMKNEIMSIKILIPDQYFIDEVKSDEDLDIIIQTMEFTKPEERQHYKGILISILNIMPYSLIRDKNSGFPVAFEYVDACGYMRHQFVQPNHRRQGLGKAVEQDICKKCINIDITPYKWVGLFNSSVYEATMRSGFWTLWEDNGEPVKLRTMKQTTANMPKP
uniref:Glycine N-acyltransferase-like protein n=1 Tax=Acrobeloides nanus TaxID=290746 RepID=A0A914E4M3_9BILA